MCINLIYTKLRRTQTATVIENEDGSHTILVNLNKPLDNQRNSILHELGHIQHGDLHKEQHVNIIERIAHAKDTYDIDTEDINFFCHFVEDVDDAI